LPPLEGPASSEDVDVCTLADEMWVTELVELSWAKIVGRALEPNHRFLDRVCVADKRVAASVVAEGVAFFGQPASTLAQSSRAQ